MLEKQRMQAMYRNLADGGVLFVKQRIQAALRYYKSHIWIEITASVLLISAVLLLIFYFYLRSQCRLPAAAPIPPFPRECRFPQDSPSYDFCKFIIHPLPPAPAESRPIIAAYLFKHKAYIGRIALYDSPLFLLRVLWYDLGTVT